MTSCKVAFSGGLDSTVLLHALARLREEQRFRLEAIHIDHGLQPDSIAWSRHCEAICDQLKVKCYLERVVVARNDGQGLEAAARRARYDCLRRYVAAGEILVTAQHQDDQAETLLLQLLRGSGVHGLAGMRAVMTFGDGYLVRPLLGFSRASLEIYARREGLAWVEDGTNRDFSYSRNFLRHEVLPLIEERWPGAPERLSRTAVHARDASVILDEVAQIDLSSSIVADNSRGLSIKAMREFSPARMRNLLRYWLRMSGWPTPSALHLEQVREMCEHVSRSQHAVVSWPGVEVHRYRDQLHALRPLPSPGMVDVPWDGTSSLLLPALNCRLTVISVVGQGLASRWLNGGQARVRIRRGGERCRPAGRGHTHKLKKLLQECGIPPWRRERLPLLYVGEDIAAVPNVCVCEPYQAGPGEEGIHLLAIDS